MIELPADQTLLTSSFATLVASLVMVLGGALLILSGAQARVERLAKRIEKAQWGAPKNDNAPEKAPRAKERLTPDEDARFTSAEHRQIIRIFTRFGAEPERAMALFNTTRLVFTLIAAGATVPFVWRLAAKQPAAALLAAGVAAVIGWFLPMMIVRRGVARHSRAIGMGLPDALELLAVCVEAGLSLENALQRVSRELKRSQPELSEELATTWAEINILPNRDQALNNLADRVNVASVRSVVTTLLQTLRYGTPLAKSLRVVAADVRGDQLTAMEEKANRLPALMTVPVMLFIMPTIFLIVGGPAALKLMDIFYRH